MVKIESSRWVKSSLAGSRPVLFRYLTLFTCQSFWKTEQWRTKYHWNDLGSTIRRYTSSQITTNVGGGMLGAFIYNLTFFLIAQPGSYFVAVLLILGGAVLFSNVEGHQLLNALQVMGDRFQELLEGDPESEARKQGCERRGRQSNEQKRRKQTSLLRKRQPKLKLRKWNKSEPLVKKNQVKRKLLLFMKKVNLNN